MVLPYGRKVGDLVLRKAADDLCETRGRESDGLRPLPCLVQQESCRGVPHQEGRSEGKSEKNICESGSGGEICPRLRGEEKEISRGTSKTDGRGFSVFDSFFIRRLSPIVFINGLLNISYVWL